MCELRGDFPVRVDSDLKNNLHNQNYSRALTNEIIVGRHSTCEGKWSLRIEAGLTSSNETILLARGQVRPLDALPVGVR